jgi:hypothetical protein
VSERNLLEQDFEAARVTGLSDSAAGATD